MCCINIAGSHPRNFSLYYLLRNAVVTNKVVTGKQVALTDNVITVNLHWPGLNNLNGQLKISFGINFMYHFRNWFYDVEVTILSIFNGNTKN